VSIQAPIAAANGASSANTALQELFLWSFLNLKLGLCLITKEEGELVRNGLNLKQERESKRIIVEEEQQQEFMGTRLRELRFLCVSYFWVQFDWSESNRDKRHRKFVLEKPNVEYTNTIVQYNTVLPRILLIQRTKRELDHYV
jgi:hypothetical protein